MASTHKFFVVQCQDWIVAIQEVRVEDDLDAVMRVIEQLDASDLVKNRIVQVVSHIVRRDGWKTAAFESKSASLE